MSAKSAAIVAGLATLTVTTPDGRTLKPHRRGSIAMAAASLVSDREHEDNTAIVKRYLGEDTMLRLLPDRENMRRAARAAGEIVRRQHGKTPEEPVCVPEERFARKVKP